MKPKSLKENEMVVIFRKERNPYTDLDQYIAVFPDEHDVPSRPYDMMCIAFYLAGDRTIFECHGSMCPEYYYQNTKRISKEESEWCREQLQQYYNSTDYKPEDHVELVVRQKMYHGRGC